jgi:5-methylcytosine-specific restriction enzyme A
MKTPCRHPGCSALLTKSGYCATHQASAPRQHTLYDRYVRQRDPALAMAARIRNSARWKTVRRQVLDAYPLCADPHGEHQRQGTTRTATEVHHITGLAESPELAFESSNLSPLCSRCHARIEREHRKHAATRPEQSSRETGGDAPAFG